MDNLCDTDKFLETQNLPGPIHGETENPNKPVIIEEIGLRIKNLPTK